MAKLFINYRREDSSPYVGRLVDHLEQLFKDGEVFRDIESIVPGEDFKKAIDEAIKSFDYVLVIIGPAWLSTLKKRGAKDSKDFVRLEIASALQQGKKVIPVFVGRASMPAKKHLPKDIAILYNIHGLELTDSQFKDDVQKLVETMGGSRGTFRMFFEVPFILGYKNSFYLLIALQGPKYNRFWEVTASTSSGVAVRPVSDPKSQQKIYFLKYPRGVGKSHPVASRLDLNLKSGRYKLWMNLKQRKLKYGRLLPGFQELFKSASFHLHNGQTVAFKGVVKSEQDMFHKIKFKLELEWL